MKLEQKYPRAVIEKGKDYLEAVEYCIKIEGIICGRVQGAYTYKTEVDLKSLDGNCSCPHGTNCKHAVALYLIYENGRFWDAEDFIKNLDKMSHSQQFQNISFPSNY